MKAFKVDTELVKGYNIIIYYQGHSKFVVLCMTIEYWYKIDNNIIKEIIKQYDGELIKDKKISTYEIICFKEYDNADKFKDLLNSYEVASMMIR